MDRALTRTWQLPRLLLFLDLTTLHGALPLAIPFRPGALERFPKKSRINVCCQRHQVELLAVVRVLGEQEGLCRGASRAAAVPIVAHGAEDDL